MSQPLASTSWCSLWIWRRTSPRFRYSGWVKIISTWTALSSIPAKLRRQGKKQLVDTTSPVEVFSTIWNSSSLRSGWKRSRQLAVRPSTMFRLRVRTPANLRMSFSSRTERKRRSGAISTSAGSMAYLSIFRIASRISPAMCSAAGIERKIRFTVTRRCIRSSVTGVRPQV